MSLARVALWMPQGRPLGIGNHVEIQHGLNPLADARSAGGAPGCAGGSSVEVVLQDLELEKCVRVGVAEDWRRVRHHRPYVYFVECAFIPKAHFALFTDHAAKA
ncbi:hypothetical protein EVAR_65570_1 [Eumeta japonica]|uniref:Uncharacterized protein n=1 Tax=Eumeta variegata TaxID=151549 RepID=A0A4C1ZBZ9_EUMVA|nr:hypothetical protein EVAR_65570_1 [Eumeta japonica]